MTVDENGLQIDEETIASIVEDAMNSAIPESWEVSRHAAQRILALVLPAIERARVEEREANGWHLSAFDDEALFSCLVNGETVASVSITKADGIAYAYKRKRGGQFVPGQIAEPLNDPQAFAEDLFDAVAAAIRKG